MRFGRKSFVRGALGTALAGLSPFRTARAESSELRISSLQGFGFLPLFIALDRHLIQKQAAARGLPDLTINHVPLRSAAISTDAMLAGQLDVIVGTTTPMLVLWDKTDGEVKGLAALGGQVLTLVTRNPRVRSIVDFGPGDRIAVPSVRQGPHSVVIGLALDQALGIGSHGKLDQIQVGIGHSDAVTMVLNPSHEVNSHFSTFPYVETELRSVAPKVHAVLTSSEVMGGPVTTISAYAHRRFVEANPVKTAALVAALDEGCEIMARDRMAAATSYITVTGEKFTPETLHELLKGDNGLYSGVPLKTGMLADQMARTGLIKRKHGSWKDFHFPFLHDRPGS